MDQCIDDYLNILNDKKPITVRQCIQSLHNIVPYKNHLHLEITNKIMSINIPGIKETMRKLVLLDILEILAVIRKYQSADEMESYIVNALSDQILDKKTKANWVNIVAVMPSANYGHDIIKESLKKFFEWQTSI